MRYLNRIKLIVILSAIMSAVSFAGQKVEAEESQSSSYLATWQTKEVKFWYAGYNTYYSCDAFEDKLEALVLAFGAAEDVSVKASGCFTGNAVDRHISVKMRFSVPVLVTEGEGDEQLERFQASLQTVVIKNRKPRAIESGDCELVEHFTRYVLPEFAPHKSNKNHHCFRGSVNRHSLSLSAQVLKKI